MDEISVDLLSHYAYRINQAVGQMQACRERFAWLEQTLDGADGAAARALRDKLEELEQGVCLARAECEKALFILQGIQVEP